MPKDWNCVSESDSDLEDERSQQEEQQVKTEKAQSKTNQVVQGSSTDLPAKSKSAQDVKERPKFMSDEELIEKIKSKQIDERKKIKIVNCKSEQLIEMIHNHKLISYLGEIKKQGKPTTYIACFRTEEDLISFIQEKIANKYRFFLHQYIKTARDIQKEKEYEEKRRQRYEEEQKERDRQNNYRNRDYRDDRRGEESRRGEDNRKREDNNRKEEDNRRREDNSRRKNDNRRGVEQGEKKRGRNRPEYDVEEKEEKKYQDKKEKRYQPKNNQKKQQKPTSQSSVNTPASKPQPKQKPQQTAEFNYVIQKNQIRILSNIYSKNRIVDDICDRKIASKWDRIKIYVKRDGLNKVLQLIELIWNRIKYGLKALPDENTKEEFIQVILETKCHVIHPNSEYGLLTDNSKKYFQNVGSKNKYILQKEFSIEEYIKGFKQNQRDICKKWKDWIIKAENQNIPNLLKLSWKLRRELYLNINIVVGKREQVPFAVLEIQPESDKEKRPKPDTSVVNNYLN